MTCVTCNEEIPGGAERKWGKKFKCPPCMKAYNAAKTARNRDKQRGPDWQPKSTPRHAMLDCNGKSHRCTGCLVIMPVTDFPKNPGTPCGYDPRCKQCRHEARRERMGAVLEKPRCVDDEERNSRRVESFRKFRYVAKYNISVDMYNWLLHTQGYVCFLCKEIETRTSKYYAIPYSLSIDHDHRCCEGYGSCSKCIRHLLCTKCNTMIGTVESKPALTYRFADYINLRPLESYPGEGNW